MYIVYHSLEYKVLILLGHQDLIEREDIIDEVIGSKFCIKMFWLATITKSFLLLLKNFGLRGRRRGHKSNLPCVFHEGSWPRFCRCHWPHVKLAAQSTWPWWSRSFVELNLEVAASFVCEASCSNVAGKTRIRRSRTRRSFPPSWGRVYVGFHNPGWRLPRRSSRG